MPTTVFWPIDVKRSGFCYGWTIPTICIAGVIPVDTEQQAELALQSSYGSDQWKFLMTSCGSRPAIIGKCEFKSRHGGRGPFMPELKLWNSEDYTIIYYQRHNQRALRFYSLNPLRFDASNRADETKKTGYSASVQHDFTALRITQPTSSLNDIVINQFNSAQALDDAIQIQNHVSFFQASFTVFLTYLSTSLRHADSIPHILSPLCNLPILLSLSYPRLKDVSAIVQQMDVRSEQMDFFATEVVALGQRTSTPIHLYSSRYTNFFNTVWLILNDITMGVAFGSFLCENHILLSEMLNRTVEDSLVNWVQEALDWLDSWPAGLKLNTELSRFYSHSFIGLVTVWGGLLLRCAPYSPFIMYSIGTLSCGGITLAISLFLDILALITAHIYICYVLSGAVYQMLLRTAGSLWNLFRGKRYNVLRNRTDSWEYDIDQLLFGTILFTLLAFLFPTVLVYYALFALLRLFVLVLQASLETLLALMNHFPLFALMLRVKDPWRLPGGVYFAIIHVPGSKHPILAIRNQPVPLSSIFFQYIPLLSRLASHYNPLRLLRCLFSGEYLAAIPRYSIRYNKIPITAPPKDD